MTPRTDSSASPPPADGPPGQSGWDRPLLLGLILVAVGAAAYANSLDGAFIFDDVHAIVENPHLLRLWPLTESMDAPPQSSLSGRPIVSLSFALNQALTGMSPRGFRAINVLIHLSAGLLLFGLIRRTLSGAPGLERLRGSAPIIAFAASLWWLVHPLQTQAVTYLVQRAESLMGLFYVATLYCFIRATTSKRPLGWHVASVFSCALGMGTKEVMATAPLLVYWYDAALLCGNWRGPIRSRPIYYAALASTWLILAALMISGPRSYSAGFRLDNITPLGYALSQPDVVLHYIRLALWPGPLCLDYGWRVAKSAVEVWPQLLIMTAILGATVWAVIRRPKPGFLGGAFFLILAPSSSFVPIKDLCFEHRVYLSLGCLCCLLALAVHALLAAGSQRGIWSARTERASFAGIAVVVALSLAVRTHLRNRDYASPAAMWTDVIASRPDNPRAYVSLASHLVLQGDNVTALDHLKRAIAMYPTYSEALALMGLTLVRMGRFDEAAPFAEAAVRADETYWQGHDVMGIVLARRNRLDEAAACFQSAMRHNPDAADPPFNLACVYDRKGDLRQAEPLYRLVLRLDPTRRLAHFNLAELLVRTNRIDQAVEHFQNAVRIQPDWARAHNALGNALARLDRLEEARSAYDLAVRRSPKDAGVQLNLGNVLFRLRRFDEAAVCYEAAFRLNPKLPTLAERLRAVRAELAAASSRPSG